MDNPLESFLFPSINNIGENLLQYFDVEIRQNSILQEIWNLRVFS